MYIPLGGSLSKGITLRNVGIVFVVSGLWHGANWTFIVWGITHFIYYTPEYLVKTNRTYLGAALSPSFSIAFVYQSFSQLKTFLLVAFAWIFFRSEDIYNAYEYIVRMCTTYSGSFEYIRFLYYPALLLFFDYLSKKDEVKLYSHLSSWIVYLIDFFLLYSVVGYFNNTSRFIYFAF